MLLRIVDNDCAGLSGIVSNGPGTGRNVFENLGAGIMGIHDESIHVAESFEVEYFKTKC